MDRHSQLKAIVIAFCLFTFIGCQSQVTWDSASRSPDGTWVATALTIEHAGFGTGGVETMVEIKRPGSYGSRELVLAFADGGRDIGLKLQWDGPRHLIAVVCRPSRFALLPSC